MPSILLVIGSVPAKKFAHVRHDLLRKGKPVEVKRVSIEDVYSIYDAIQADREAKPYPALDTEVNLRERAVVRRLIGCDPRHVAAVVYSAEAYEYLDDPVLTSDRLSITDGNYILCDEKYIAHPDWVEKR